MKNFLKTALLAIIAINLIYCSDQNYRMVTIMNKDGSFQRTIYAEVDSSFVAGDMSKNPFLIEMDSCWKFIDINTEEVINDFLWDNAQTVKLGIRRQFSSFEEFNNLQFNEKNRHIINPEETFRKKFKWFFTYYTYQSVYQLDINEFLIPLDKYMTKTEQKIFLQGDLSTYKGWTGFEILEELDVMKEKFEKWYWHNIYELEFNSIYHFAKNHNLKYASQMPEVKDSLFNLYYNTDLEKFYFLNLDLTESLDKFFDTDEFFSLYTKYDEDIKKYSENQYQEFSILFSPQSIDYELILPGKLLQTNAMLISGDTLKWKVDTYRTLPSEYILSAQSRISNVWAFILTLLPVIISVYCFVKKRKYERG